MSPGSHVISAPTAASQVAAKWFKSTPVREVARISDTKTFEQLKQTHAAHGHLAFAGRSNVGKSSLINAVFDRHKRSNHLSKTSSTPGKTQALHCFRVGASGGPTAEQGFIMVDMPGVGYAKAGRHKIRQWNEAMADYLTACVPDPLRLLVYLVDSRHGLKDMDRSFLDFLAQQEVPFMVCLTKLDKAAEPRLEATVQNLREELQAMQIPNVLPLLHATSSSNKAGLGPLRCTMARSLGLVTYPLLQP